MSHRLFRLLVGALALAPLGCGQASGDQEGPTSYPFVLTRDELILARTLAERDLPADALPSGPRTIFIKVDLLPGSDAAATQRLVMVHHYRYQADETIFTMIDLHTHEIMKRESYLHYPTALAPLETERAFQLVRADGRLRPLLETIPTQLDARPIQYAAPDEPLFGRRVVHVLLRQEGNYLMSPRVLVDLTTETVHLDTN